MRLLHIMRASSSQLSSLLPPLPRQEKKKKDLVLKELLGFFGLPILFTLKSYLKRPKKEFFMKNLSGVIVSSFFDEK